MTFDPVAAAKRYLDAVNDLDFAVIEDFYAEDAVYGSVKVGGLKGREAILKAFRQYFETYPDQEAVDELIEQLIPLLEPGDILIDGGNSHFPDTIRRTQYLAEKGLRFIGTGGKRMSALLYVPSTATPASRARSCSGTPSLS